MFIVIYFSNKWGSEIIVKATEKEEEVSKLLLKLQSTFEKVEETTILK